MSIDPWSMKLRAFANRTEEYNKCEADVKSLNRCRNIKTWYNNLLKLNRDKQVLTFVSPLEYHFYKHHIIKITNIIFANGVHTKFLKDYNYVFNGLQLCV